jgi:L-threonylcarbamoyladenylate synthase
LYSMYSLSLIPQAVALLRQGGLVAFPTETVYGLGADARNAVAVQKIFAAKGRPADHPLIVHIGDVSLLEAWASTVPPRALRLAEAFWPGPLTLILKKHPSVLPAITGGQETVGLRMPSHPIAQALLQAFGEGVAAPSANRFTRLSPTTAEAVKEELGDQVDLILDGEPCVVGVESTIVDVSGAVPVLLRPGMITQAALEAVLGERISARQSGAVVRTSGMHALHYAPVTPMQLIDTALLNQAITALSADALPIALVTHSLVQQLPSEVHHVQMPQDAVEYARKLYATLRELDHQRFKQILVEAPPQEAAWGAIQDRLQKACGRG